ncbi:MAG: SPFH domain-containing protein [Fastidiosipilaceae bacterium]|jgi:regulator of protease activity HflC (stomatin/prohibitin superfamily)
MQIIATLPWVGWAVISVILTGIIFLVVFNIRIVPQTEVHVVERLGSFLTVWRNGVHVKVPLIDRIAQRISTKERVADYPPQSIITKDNVTIEVDSIVYYKVIDATRYTYSVQEPELALQALCTTSLRALLGNMLLEESLTNRNQINAQMQSIVDQTTKNWGISVLRVELQNIQPPLDVQQAMERQMKAEREKREKILRAEGEQQSLVLVAEGRKKAAILEAEADKDQVVLRAEGEAEALEIMKTAERNGWNLLNAIKPSEALLKMKALETLETIGVSQSSKIIIPQNMDSLSGLLSTAGTIIKSENNT